MPLAPVSTAEKVIAQTRSDLAELTKGAWILSREIRYIVRGAKGRDLTRDAGTAWLIDRLEILERKLSAFGSRAYHHNRRDLAALQNVATAMRECEEP